MAKMKKLATIIIILLMLVGCKETEKDQLRVYSFEGENENFTVSNGIIVLHNSEEIFDGGQTEYNRLFFQ